MKKALVISIIAFLVSAIAFGVSIPLTGLREGQGFGISIGSFPSIKLGGASGEATKAGDIKTYEFDSAVRDIQVATTVADTTVTVCDVEKISVTYETTTGGYYFDAHVDGQELIISEEGGFLFNLFSFGKKESKLKVLLPEKEYGDVEIITASGNTNIDNLVCWDFESVVTSGNSDYKIFAQDIEVTTTSGSVNIENCTERRAKEIKLDSVSGEHTISGFKCDEYKLNSVSGTITANGISGKGKADIVSGEIYIAYSEWYGGLSLDAVSGYIDVTLPQDSGVVVDLTAISGGVNVELKDKDGEVMSASLSGDSESGKIGGVVVNTVKVDLVSGEVNIHNYD